MRGKRKPEKAPVFKSEKGGSGKKREKDNYLWNASRKQKDSGKKRSGKNEVQ